MKKYTISLLFFIFSFACFISYSSIGSYVSKDGILVDPFELIIAGFLLFALSVISGLAVSSWSLFHSPKMHDRWLFGLFFSICAFCTVYLVASMSYLSQQADEEILQNTDFSI
jgi:Protein of unknown function (DUF3955)